VLISFEPNDDISDKEINCIISNSLDIGEFKILNFPYLESHPDFDLLKWIQDGLQELQQDEDTRKQLQVDKIAKGYRG